MNLHEKPLEFSELIRLTATDLKIREVYVEKDYWVTLVLKRLSNHPDRENVVFKGGTSLSKAFKLVNRFSEDVDLAVIKGNATNAAVERRLKKVAKEITVAPLEEVDDPNVTSKKGQSRRTLHRYPKQTEATDYGPVRKEILLEINCFGEPHPNSKVKIASYIAEFLTKTGKQDVVGEFGLEAFEVLVLDKHTTFVEKVLSLTYASFVDGDAQLKEVRERVRHFYDLTLILRDPSTKIFLENGEFAKLVSKIRAEERLGERIKWVEQKLGSSSLFSKTDQQLKLIEEFFKTDMEPMLFYVDELPKFTEVQDAFRQISKAVEGGAL